MKEYEIKPKANLCEANLQGANLYAANLQGADLRGADLRWADLSGADLREANLCEADLREADLRWADLREANLQGADLRWADLGWADLDDAKGLIIREGFLLEFEKTEGGYVVYKSFNEIHTAPSSWIIEPGSTITEEVDKDLRNTCSHGINFGTLEWCRENCKKQIWKCLLRFEDLDELIVPYATDGKARCARLTILEVVE